MPSEPNTDTILATGGTGHLGSGLAKLLLRRQGRKVGLLARNPRRDAAVKWVCGDISTGEGLGEAFRGVHIVLRH